MTVAPIATLRLGLTLNPDVIKEGDDVYFDCSIRSNPDVVRLIWKLEVSTKDYISPVCLQHVLLR